ncbi:MAG: glycosyl hydrolase, partial [Acidimicrobiales bacterium]
EASEKDERGFYRSADRGHSWERRNEYLSGGTGPHYYQEIFASPTNPDRVYQVDVFLHVTADGGTTFRNLEDGKHKHSDNHVVWIDPADGLHLLAGTDAGLYESFDDGGSWRHVSNLPISQFYRVAVDGSAPFTNVLGGAQDLGTVYGPVRTGHVDGVRNQDWAVPLGADGYHVAFDPDDPDVCYLEWQVGNVMRLDRRSMELVDIQPQPGPDDPPERWNWDTPIEISPHYSGRIYVASQRVWQSDDGGDSWTPISPDLTTDPNRYELAVGERTVSVDSLYDHEAMSLYGTVTTLSESPIEPGRIYAGTDDGRLHSGDRDGDTVTWRPTNRPSDLPEQAYINDVKASLHEPDSVFLVADDHKSGDFTPYLYESTDRGSTWRSIGGGLPTNTIVWVIEQDHVDPDLLFVGAEHGLFVSRDRGESWLQLTSGLPTVAFRDLAIQRRDDDLVAASFGRGLYVLDDYSPLRERNGDNNATLFPVRDAWWHVPHEPMQAKGQPTLGSTAFRAANPPFGATFTYRIGDELRTAKAQRRMEERTLEKRGQDVPSPGSDRLWTEHLETEPIVWLVVRDGAGEPIRLIDAEKLPGLHRSAWDLRYPPPQPVTLEKPEFEPPWTAEPRGPLVPPGTYTVELATQVPGGMEVLAGPERFSVVAIPAVDSPVAAGEPAEVDEFRRDAADLARRVEGAVKHVEATGERLKHLRAGLGSTSGGPDLLPRVEELHRRLELIDRELRGDPVRRRLHIADTPSVHSLVERVVSHHWQTTTAPTPTQRQSIERAAELFGPLVAELSRLVDVDLADLTADADRAGSPWTPR